MLYLSIFSLSPYPIKVRPSINFLIVITFVVLFYVNLPIIMCDLTIKDPTIGHLNKRKYHEKTKKNQASWIAYLPLAKNVINDKGSIHQIWCKICTRVEGRESL
jgi:hypothetical protein